MSDVQVDLGAPRRGWLPIRIRAGAYAIECHASHIVDVVTDLVYAALELTEQRPIRPVVIFEEPEAVRISLGRSRRLVAITITRHRDLASARNDRAGTLLFSGSVQRAQLAREIWSAAQELGAVISRAERRAWPNPFPAKEVAQLGERPR